MDFIYLLLAQMLFSLALLRMQSVSAVLFIHVYFSDVKFLSLLKFFPHPLIKYYFNFCQQFATRVYVDFTTGFIVFFYGLE